MAEAFAFFLVCTALGVLIGRGWDAAAVALCLTLLVAVTQATH
jgi:hypothetical protein